MKFWKIFLLLILISYPNLKVNCQNADIDLLKKINGSYTAKGGDFMRFVTNSDTPLSLGIPAGLCITGVVKKDPQLVFNGIESFSAQAISGIVTAGMKWGINRERPFNTYPNDVQKYAPAGSPSFPSGHTSMAFATATSISLEYPKWYVIVPSYTWAIGVGYSRMYLGVHYPSDVLVGAVIGAGSSILAHYTTRLLKKKWRLYTQETKL